MSYRRRNFRRAVKPQPRPDNWNCMHTRFRLPCVTEGKHEFCHIMGPHRPFKIEDARRYAAGQIDGRNPDLREAVAQHMATWGGCVWHACAELLGRPCECAGCKDPKHYRHAWITDSARIYAEGDYPKLKVKRSDTWTVEIEAVA